MIECSCHSALDFIANHYIKRLSICSYLVEGVFILLVSVFKIILVKSKYLHILVHSCVNAVKCSVHYTCTVTLTRFKDYSFLFECMVLDLCAALTIRVTLIFKQMGIDTNCNKFQGLNLFLLWIFLLTATSVLVNFLFNFPMAANVSKRADVVLAYWPVCVIGTWKVATWYRARQKLGELEELFFFILSALSSSTSLPKHVGSV